MTRTSAEGKTLWHLTADGPMLRRWAEHLTRGAVDNGAQNWLKASGEAEYQRFRESAFRHFMQWFYGEADEDHASAVFFNINGAEYVKGSPMNPDSWTVIKDVEPRRVPERPEHVDDKTWANVLKEWYGIEPDVEPCGKTEWCNDCGGEFPESCDCVDLPGESLDPDEITPEFIEAVDKVVNSYITVVDDEVVPDHRFKPCFPTCNGVCRDCEGVERKGA